MLNILTQCSSIYKDHAKFKILVLTVMFCLMESNLVAQSIVGSWDLDQVEFSVLDSTLTLEQKNRLANKYNQFYNNSDYFESYRFNEDSTFNKFQKSDSIQGYWRISLNKLFLYNDIDAKEGKEILIYEMGSKIMIWKLIQFPLSYQMIFIRQ